jgi:hypothetical protein
MLNQTQEHFHYTMTRSVWQAHCHAESDKTANKSPESLRPVLRPLLAHPGLRKHLRPDRIHQVTPIQLNGARFTEEEARRARDGRGNRGGEPIGRTLRMTHSEAPWRLARERTGVGPDEASNELITNEDLRSFFGQLAEQGKIPGLDLAACLRPDTTRRPDGR